VLIIDDASPDNTAEVAQQLKNEDGRVDLLRHKTNKGHIATYNEGIEWASADYMLLLSADDIVLPCAFARAMNLMDRYPNVGMTFGRAIDFSGAFPTDRLFDGSVPMNSPIQSTSDKAWQIQASDPPAKRWNVLRYRSRGQRALAIELDETRIINSVDFIKLNRHTCRVNTATAIVRTLAQKEVGGYRKELPHAGDIEMWLRFAVNGPIGFIGAYQAGVRKHPENMSKLFRGLGDMHQRKLVLDNVFEHDAGHIYKWKSLKSYMYRSLAEYAVQWAGTRYFQGDHDSCRELLRYAEQLNPRIRNTLFWQLHAVKRRMGPEAWSVIGPLARRFV
jgi:glycosyltransferase involved in cell wall biosynthesis